MSKVAHYNFKFDLGGKYMAKDKKHKRAATIENRKARHNYKVIETLECGIELRGNEVKALRVGAANLTEAWVAVENNELIIKNFYITKWDTANNFDVSEKRERRLLAHKYEIRKIQAKVKEKGFTLIPLKVYFSDNNKAKLLLGLCTGLHKYDIREKEAKAQANRDIARYTKQYNLK